MTDVFDAPLPLTELEAYIIATAMQIADEHTDSSQETKLLQERLRRFIGTTWPAPDADRIIPHGRINIDTETLDAILRDAGRYRTLMDPANILSVHAIVEMRREDADARLDWMERHPIPTKTQGH